MNIALKIDFDNAAASFKRVHSLPIDTDDFTFSSGRKRAFESVFLRIDDVAELDVQYILGMLASDDEVRRVTQISEKEFWAAPSHGM